MRDLDPIKEAALHQLVGKYFSYYRPIIKKPESELLYSFELVYVVWKKEENQVAYKSDRSSDNLAIDVTAHWVHVSGFWRHALLSFVYSPSKAYWYDEDGIITTPYPEGAEIEKLAAQLWELLNLSYSNRQGS
jgi:hypothetical protein